MHDLREFLEQAIDNLPSVSTADPEGDLRRGRRLLRLRRGLRAAYMVAGVAAAIVLVPLVAASHTPVAASHHSGVGGVSGSGVRLVAYTGTQPPGYTVQEMPAGWVIQGSNAYTLVIAPANFPDKQPDSFIGKLVVMWGSEANGSGVPVTVNGHQGFFSADSGAKTEVLVFKDAAGRWLDVQAPQSLGWDVSHLVRFGAGITVLPGARQSHG